MKPARLGKCNANQVLEEQLSISTKEIIIIFLFVLFFGIMCVICKGPTYGML